MAQVVLYLDNAMAEQIDFAAKREGKSRSAWVRQAVARQLREPARSKFPDWWWKNLGTWEDDRCSEEILADIDAGLSETGQPELD
jgi:hypothetical protein